MASYSQRFDLFIGRWRVFHAGHMAMIRKVWEQNKRPVMVLVMDTDEEPPAPERKAPIAKWLRATRINGLVWIIPPVASVNYGRKVGYEINEVRLSDELEAISATALLGGV